MKDFFADAFAYAHHNNVKMAELFAQHGERVPQKSQQWFSHMLNAHAIWNSRIHNITPRHGVWDIHSVHALLPLAEENYQASLAILEKYPLQQVVTYTNTQGLAFTNTIQEIFFHVVNHTTHHRAQIASDLKQHGIEPFISDYIFYKRKQVN